MNNKDNLVQISGQAMLARTLYVGMRSVFAAVTLGVCLPAAAQQAPQAPLQGAGTLPPAMGQPTPPGGIPAGPLIIYPGIDVGVGYDDNLFLSDINKRSSTGYFVTPYVRVEGKPGPHKFDVTFRVVDATYTNSKADNFTDYFLTANADLAISGRAGLKVRAEYTYGHDRRGSTDRAASATPDEYVNQGIGGIFSYGAPGARGRIEIDAGAFSRRYENNRATT